MDNLIAFMKYMPEEVFLASDMMSSDEEVGEFKFP
jgi:hypothetical protein